MPTALVGNLDNAILLLPSDRDWTSTSLTYRFATTFASLPSGYANSWTGLYDAAGNRLNYTQNLFEPWALDKKTDAEQSLRELASFTDLSFTPVSSGEIMTFGALSTLAYTEQPGNPDRREQPGGGYYPNAQQPFRGDVWLYGDINNGPTVTHPTYWQQVIPHEIGHAMGLRHPRDVGLGDIYSNYSVMSYGHVLRSQEFHGANIFTREYQLYDIAALQYRYGADYSTNAGDTTYSTHDELLPGETGARIRYYSVWDGGGLDTLAAGNTGSWGAYIDLRPGHFSSVGANSRVSIYNGSLTDSRTDFGVQNVSIAFGAAIEDATGSANDDVIIGNIFDNVLRGGAGNDVIYADGYNISYQEADYREVDRGFYTINIDPFEQLDDLYGDEGNDTLFGSSGSDWMYGGAGVDVASYAREHDGVTIRYDGRSAQPSITVVGPLSGNDALFDIERVVLSNYNDRLEVFGRVTTNITVDGGPGVESAVDGDQATTPLSIVVNPDGSGYVRNSDGTGGQITLENFRTDITGSAFGDQINDQSGHRNVVSAGAGDDLVRTGGDDDYIDGGSGQDDLYGEDGADTIAGGDGNDRLTGGDGADRFVFEGAGIDIITDFRRGDTIDLSALGVDRSDVAIRKGRIFVDLDGDADLTIVVHGGRVAMSDIDFGSSAASIPTSGIAPTELLIAA